MNLVAIGLGALAVALVATPVAIVIATRSDIVDRPGALKGQSAPVPYLGGVAVFLGSAVGVLAGRPSVLVPLALALLLGVADDRFDIAPVFRLVGEVLVGCAVAATVPVHLPGGVGTVAVIVVTIALINGVNLIDGLDMLAAGVTCVAAVAFALVLEGSGRQMAVAVAAALIGFLAFNRPPARIYLGDGGSYLLGTALAVLVAASWGPHVRVHIGAASLALVAIPVGEVAFAVVRRVRGRVSLTAGDRAHPYDRLVARGWHRTAASGAYIACEAVVATGAVVLAHRAGLPAIIAFDCAVGAVLLALAAAVGALTPDLEASP